MTDTDCRDSSLQPTDRGLTEDVTAGLPPCGGNGLSGNIRVSESEDSAPAKDVSGNPCQPQKPLSGPSDYRVGPGREEIRRIVRDEINACLRTAFPSQTKQLETRIGNLERSADERHSDQESLYAEIRDLRKSLRDQEKEQIAILRDLIRQMQDVIPSSMQIAETQASSAKSTSPEPQSIFEKTWEICEFALSKLGECSRFGQTSGRLQEKVDKRCQSRQRLPQVLPASGVPRETPQTETQDPPLTLSAIAGASPISVTSEAQTTPEIQTAPETRTGPETQMAPETQTVAAPVPPPLADDKHPKPSAKPIYIPKYTAPQDIYYKWNKEKLTDCVKPSSSHAGQGGNTDSSQEKENAGAQITPGSDAPSGVFSDRPETAADDDTPNENQRADNSPSYMETEDPEPISAKNPVPWALPNFRLGNVILLTDGIFSDFKRKIFLIGDLHSDDTALRRILHTILTADPSAIIVFMGDIFDRGNDHLRTARRFIETARRHPGQLLWLQGNHDIALSYDNTSGKFKSDVDPAEFALWLNTEATEDEKNEARALIKIIATLPVVAIFGDAWVSHGGIPHERLANTFTDFESMSREIQIACIWNRAADSKKKLENKSHRGSDVGFVQAEYFFNILEEKQHVTIRKLICAHQHNVVQGKGYRPLSRYYKENLAGHTLFSCTKNENGKVFPCIMELLPGEEPRVFAITDEDPNEQPGVSECPSDDSCN